MNKEVTSPGEFHNWSETKIDVVPNALASKMSKDTKKDSFMGAKLVSSGKEIQGRITEAGG